MLPKRDGLSLIEELRRRGVTTPVLIRSKMNDQEAEPQADGPER